MDKKIETVYEEFQSELHLNHDCLEKAKNLHEILVTQESLRSEPPHLIAASCILTISCMNKSPKTLGEISKILHVKEDHILKFQKFVAEQMKIMLKNF